MCKDFFELENFKFFYISKILKFQKNSKKKIIIKNFENFDIFLDQNIFKNISQIQLNENGPEGRPGPAGHSSTSKSHDINTVTANTKSEHIIYTLECIY